MELKNLQIENFFSYGPSVAIDFEAIAGSPCLIQGKVKGASEDSNGAGKSAMFEAFHWCLTGRTVRGVKAKEVVRSGENKVFVQSLFNHAGKAWQVSRTWSDKVKKIEVVVDEKTHEFHDSRQGTESLFEMLGISQEVFSLLTFTGRKFISFSYLSPKERADLVDNVVDGTLWKKGSELAGRKLSAVKTELKGKEFRKDELEGDARDADKHIEAKEQELKVFKEDVCVKYRAEAKEKIAAVESELDKARAIYNIAKESLSKDLESVEIANKQIVAMENTLESASSKYEASFREHMQIKGELEDRKRKIASLHEKLPAIQKALDDLKQQKDTGKCPACGQELQADYDWEKHRQKEKEIDSSAKQILAGIESEEKLLADASEKEVVLKGYVDKNNDRKQQIIAQSANEKRQVNAVISSYKTREMDLNGKGKEVERIQGVLAAEQKKEQDVEIYIAATQSKLDHQFDTLKEKKKEISAAIEKNKNEMLILLQEETVYEYWKKGFKDIYYSKFDYFLEFLESLLNDYCWRQGLDVDSVCLSSHRQLASGEQKPEITLTVKRGGEMLSLDSLSEGETQRMDLAVFLSLREVLSRFGMSNWNLMVLDEPLSGLDAHGMEEAFRIVSDMSADNQVFVIDHNSEFKNRFASVLTVVKDGSSRIE